MTDATDDPAPRPIDTPVIGERRRRSLVDLVRARFDEALDAARVAGRAETVLDMAPSPVARAAYDAADRAAVIGRELAHGALDTLARS